MSRLPYFRQHLLSPPSPPLKAPKGCPYCTTHNNIKHQTKPARLPDSLSGDPRPHNSKLASQQPKGEQDGAALESAAWQPFPYPIVDYSNKLNKFGKNQRDLLIRTVKLLSFQPCLGLRSSPYPLPLHTLPCISVYNKEKVARLLFLKLLHLAPPWAAD